MPAPSGREVLGTSESESTIMVWQVGAFVGLQVSLVSLVSLAFGSSVSRSVCVAASLVGFFAGSWSPAFVVSTAARISAVNI